MQSVSRIHVIIIRNHQIWKFVTTHQRGGEIRGHIHSKPPNGVFT